jgi:hypothetical protein
MTDNQPPTEDRSRKATSPDTRREENEMYPLEFDNFSDAFDYCRECDRPVVVNVDGELWKLFPSGKAEYKGIA